MPDGRDAHALLGKRPQRATCRGGVTLGKASAFPRFFQTCPKHRVIGPG